GNPGVVTFTLSFGTPTKPATVTLTVEGENGTVQAVEDPTSFTSGLSVFKRVGSTPTSKPVSQRAQIPDLRIEDLLPVIILALDPFSLGESILQPDGADLKLVLESSTPDRWLATMPGSYRDGVPVRSVFGDQLVALRPDQ